MKCGYPYKLNEDTVVPCGRCMPCRITKRSQWAGRILLEAKYSTEPSSFITLTYNDDHLPKLGHLHKPDLVGFTNRIRHRSGMGHFRFFAIGEYGSETQRPHYHLAIFNTDPAAWEGRFTDCWKTDEGPIGHVHVGLIEKKSAEYITGYCLKKLTTMGDPRLDGKPPEFATMSKRPPLGYQGVNHIRDLLYTRTGAAGLAKRGDVPSSFRMDGKNYPLGEYWKNYLREEFNILKPSQEDWTIDYEQTKREQRQATKQAEKLWRNKDKRKRRL